jgi:hypothetical protein
MSRTARNTSAGPPPGAPSYRKQVASVAIRNGGREPGVKRGVPPPGKVMTSYPRRSSGVRDSRYKAYAKLAPHLNPGRTNEDCGLRRLIYCTWHRQETSVRSLLCFRLLADLAPATLYGWPKRYVRLRTSASHDQQGTDAQARRRPNLSTSALPGPRPGRIPSPTTTPHPTPLTAPRGPPSPVTLRMPKLPTVIFVRHPLASRGLSSRPHGNASNRASRAEKSSSRFGTAQRS